MAKKLKNLKWDSVALEGFPISITSNLDGFVGLEECTDYGLDKEVKKKQKKKKTPKKRNNTSSYEKVVPNKKVRLSNGFVVETCTPVTPSVTNSVETKSNKKKISSEEHVPPNKALATSKDIKSTKKLKPRHGENTKEIGPKLTPEDMLTWAEYKLPEPIITALAEQGFKVPTKIQQLSLPAAIHGRRDILGAAETGSGKTLAFGLPILNGIIKLKEKFEAGVDVYELQYKKSSAKKKQQNNEEVSKVKNNVSKKGNNNKNKPVPVKPKESSEDGHSSDNEHSDEEDEEESKETINKSETKTSDKGDSEDEYIEEIEVPIRKRKDSSDEGNDTDDSDDNYIHLSEILDHSAESSEEDEDEENSSINDEKSSSENEDESESDNEDEKSNVENGGNDEKSEDDENSEEDEELVGEDGIGCVKVVDNIEMPGHVVTKTGKPLYALIMTPTRELAIQVSRHLSAAAKYTGIRIATIVGGMAAVKQERVLRSGPEVVVATPGRLWELVNQGQPHLQQLDTVKFLAIDETDRMVERNHFEELHPLLERLNANPSQAAARQNFVFSATLTMVHELPSHMKGKKVTKRGKIINRKIAKMTPEQKVKRLVAMIGMTDPKVVDITQKNLGTAETLTESRIVCSKEQKDVYLHYILKRHPGRTIVFCNSIGSVKRLAQLLTLLHCRPLPLHASMEQRQRLRNLERFGADPLGVLVATDVAARGLDIPDVDHVVHYQVPRTAENYVHRSGRTARANKEGLTILMMEPAEAYLYSKLCFTLNKTSEIPSFPVAPEALSPIRDLIKLAREIDALELKKRRVSQANGWREKAAREMDIILDEDDVPSKQADPGIDKALRAKKRDLNILMSRPLIPRGFSYKYPTLNDPNALKIIEENALQVMKKSLQSGEMKKEKRKSKNAPLLKLEKMLKKK